MSSIRRILFGARLRTIVALAVVIALATQFLALGGSHKRPTTAPNELTKAAGYQVPEEHRPLDSPLGSLGIDRILNRGKRRLLVTGGASQLALALIPSLTPQYELFLLDNLPRPPSIPLSPTVHYFRPSSFRTIITSYDLEGVIDLAGLAHAERCEAAPLHCNDIHQAPLNELLDSLAHAKGGSWWSGAARAPWIIWATHTADIKSGTALNALQTYLDQSSVGHSDPSRPTRGAIVTLPYLYGFDPTISLPGSFFHSLLVNSVTSEHTQYDSDLPPLDLLHVNDAVQAVQQTIQSMDQSKPHETLLETFDFSSGHRVSRKDLVLKVRELSHSLGPVKDIGSGNAQHSLSAPLSSTAIERPKSSKKVDLETGLKQAVDSMHLATIDWAKSYIDQHCYTESHDPSLLPSNARNADLSKLDGCTVNIGFNRNDYLDYVKCPVPGNGTICTIDRKKVASMNWDASVFKVRVIEDAGWRSKSAKGRKVRVKLEEELSSDHLGIPGSIANDFGFLLYNTEREDEGHVVFDLEVSPDESYLRLLLPGTVSQVKAVAKDKETLLRMQHASEFDARMNILCCPSEGDWPLLLDDYETADILFGTTGDIPFNSSHKLHTCDRAHQAIQYSQSVLDGTATAPAQSEYISTAPEQWALRDLPPCWNDCSSPTTCVQTGSCRCIPAECPSTNRIYGISDFEEHVPVSKPKSDLGLLREFSKVLINNVAQGDWRDAVRPEFRAYLAKNSSFPSIYLVDDYPGAAEIEAAPCHHLQTKHCFSADSILYRAMRHLSTTAEDAELIVLPVYQHCDGAEFLLHPVRHWANEHIPGVKEGTKRMATVLTHDWGVCIDFAWEIWSARDAVKPLAPEPILDNVLVWTVMGDYDSPCYRPHQDLVIPARTCLTPTLIEQFSDISKVMPVGDRPKLVAWSGTYWGTGKTERLRWTCDRGGAGRRELLTNGGPESHWLGKEYMQDLGSARFCPQPRGIAGWSFRVSDSVYAGCIPVLSAEGTHYPFANSLDWSKFSVRVRPTDLDRIEEILEAIPLEEVERMQANLMLVRDAFVYSSDESPEAELERRGPMFWSLHEAGARMGSEYPSVKKDWVLGP